MTQFNVFTGGYLSLLFDDFVVFLVFDDGVYFQNSVGTTRKFDGNSSVDFNPRTLLPNDRAPGGATGVGRAGIVGEIAIIPKSFHNGVKYANFDYFVRDLN